MIDEKLLDCWRFTAGKYIVFSTRFARDSIYQDYRLETSIHTMNDLNEVATLSILLYPPLTEIDIDKILVLL